MDDKLYKFSRLAEIGNYTRAAKELHISQPALSVAIQKLEKELGAPLFIRAGKRLELTKAGRAAYQAALEHQDIGSHLRESLRRLANRRPAVTLGMVDSVASQLCATDAFDMLEQRADVTLIVNNSRYLREQVERRRVDVAITIYDELDHPGLTNTVIGNEELKLVFSPTLAATVTADLNNGILRGFISYDKPSTTYRHIQHTFSNLSVQAHTRLYSTSPSVMLSMVLRGKGCAVLPATMVAPLLEEGLLQTALPTIHRPVALLTVANKTQPEFMTDFLDEANALLMSDLV